MEQEQTRGAEGQNPNREKNHDDDGSERAGLAQRLRGFLFSRFSEGGKFLFERGEGFLVLQLAGEPLPLQTLPFFRQAGERIGGCGLKTAEDPGG